MTNNLPAIITDENIAKQFAARLSKALSQFHRFYDLKDKDIINKIVTSLRLGAFGRENVKCISKFTSEGRPYFDIYPAIIYISDFIKIYHDSSSPIPAGGIFLISDIEIGGFTDGVIKACAERYISRIHYRISNSGLSIRANKHLANHMQQICEILIENPDIDLKKLAATFKPDERLLPVLRSELSADPISISRVEHDIQKDLEKLTKNPQFADITAFGMMIGHELRDKNKAVTDWQLKNRLNLPISFALHKRLNDAVSLLKKADISGEQKIAILRKLGPLIDKIVDQLPKDQKNIVADIRDSEVAKNIIDNNSQIAEKLVDAFQSVAGDLKEKAKFDSVYVDTKEQELRLTRTVYASKVIGFEQVNRPAMMAMSMNLNAVATSLDLIIAHVEDAMRNLSAGNMKEGNRHIRRLIDKVSAIDEIVSETEMTLGLITNKDVEQLQITKQPMVTVDEEDKNNSGQEIAVIRVRPRKKGFY